MDHVYNILEQKHIDQFQKIWLESSKTPNLNRSKNPNKMHENMKINAKRRVKWTYRLRERKTLQKFRRKMAKKFVGEPCQFGEREKFEIFFEK